MTGKLKELEPTGTDSKESSGTNEHEIPLEQAETDIRQPEITFRQEQEVVKLHDFTNIKNIDDTIAIIRNQNDSNQQNKMTNKNIDISVNNSQQDGERTTIRASATVFMATFGALLGALSMGLALGYTAAAFVDMERNITGNNSILDADFDKRESQKSLIGSTLTIGAMVTALASEPCNNLFGRRIPLIVSGIPFVAGWLLLSFSDNLALLVLGRLILGACCAIVCGTAPTYVVEIAPPQTRGALGTCFQLMIVIGQLLASLLGIFLSWRNLAAISLVPAIGMSAIMLLVPESPTWLVGKQRRDEAKKALTSFRSSPIESELEEIVQAKTKQLQDKPASIYSCDILQSREFLKPLGYCLGLTFFQNATGINAIVMYQSDIFKKSAPNSDPLISTVGVLVAQVIATVVCSLFVDKLGRRVLLWISGSGCAVSLFLLGLYSHLAVNDKNFREEFALLPLISLILFVIFFSFGFGPIPWMMVPELASSQVRSMVASFGSLFSWIGAYITTATMKPLMRIIGDDWTYWISAIFCALSILFIFILPETKAKVESSADNSIVSAKS